MSTARDTDLGLGLGLSFGALALAAAAYQLFASTQLDVAWGFAAAVTAGVVAVAALHR